MNSSVLSALPTGASHDGALHQNVSNADSSMGALLLDAGKLTPENAERVLRMQKDLGIRFGEAAVRLGLVSEDDIQQVLARHFSYPYLQKGQANLSPKLVAAYDPFSPQVEALRAIRSQLMLAARASERPRRPLAVLSPNPGDGKSYLAANLAISYSQLGAPTVLIDADMASLTNEQTGSHGAGLVSFQPLYAKITREQPDLFD